MMLTTSGPEPFWVSAALRWAARPIPPDGPAMAPMESSQTAVGWFSTTRILAASVGFADCCATASDSTSAFQSGLTYCVAPTYGFTWCTSAAATGPASAASPDTPSKAAAAKAAAADKRNLPGYVCTKSEPPSADRWRWRATETVLRGSLIDWYYTSVLRRRVRDVSAKYNQWVRR